MEENIIKDYNLSMFQDVKIRHYYSKDKKYFYEEFTLYPLPKDFEFNYEDLKSEGVFELVDNKEESKKFPNQLIYDLANKNNVDYWAISGTYNNYSYESELINKDGIRFSGKLPSKWKTIREFMFVIFYIIFTILFFYFLATKLHFF